MKNIGSCVHEKEQEPAAALKSVTADTAYISFLVLNKFLLFI